MQITEHRGSRLDTLSCISFETKYMSVREKLETITHANHYVFCHTPPLFLLTEKSSFTSIHNAPIYTPMFPLHALGMRLWECEWEHHLTPLLQELLVGDTHEAGNYTECKI
jgi:hypothetical protein